MFNHTHTHTPEESILVLKLKSCRIQLVRRRRIQNRMECFHAFRFFVVVGLFVRRCSYSVQFKSGNVIRKFIYRVNIPSLLYGYGIYFIYALSDKTTLHILFVNSFASEGDSGRRKKINKFRRSSWRWLRRLYILCTSHVFHFSSFLALCEESNVANEAFCCFPWFVVRFVDFKWQTDFIEIS